MPRKVELTWQPGGQGRRGRWRKRYKGRVLYFSHGTSKSDMEGYRQALDEWVAKKAEIDAEEALQPKPHQDEYEQALGEWALVLEWSRENDDQKHATAALQKLEALKARLARANPPPLAWGDRFFDFGLPPEVMTAIVEALHRAEPPTHPPLDPNSAALIFPSKEAADSMDGSPQRIAREVWRDRLGGQRRKSGSTPKTVESCVTSFLGNKRTKVDSGELSAGRYDVLRGHLHHFQSWLGPTLPVASISAKLLLDYHVELLSGLSGKKWSADYAQNRMSAVKSFVRWLWRVEAIENLPRILDSKELNISKKVAKPEVFTIKEVKAFLAAATDRTKLYLLLMLNTGMTQKDISDLRRHEVDWRIGTITRKRSKTATHDKVPTVTYRLWKETSRLLRQERAADGDLVLTNNGGGPLKVERLDENGKLCKIDNVKSAFDRLTRVTKIKKPLKLLRKTSATLLASNRQFNGIENLFLGHAPRSISDRHYTQAPQETLNQAVVWLGQQYGIT